MFIGRGMIPFFISYENSPSSDLVFDVAVGCRRGPDVQIIIVRHEISDGMEALAKVWEGGYGPSFEFLYKSCSY